LESEVFLIAKKKKNSIYKKGIIIDLIWQHMLSPPELCCQ